MITAKLFKKTLDFSALSKYTCFRKVYQFPKITKHKNIVAKFMLFLVIMKYTKIQHVISLLCRTA